MQPFVGLVVELLAVERIGIVRSGRLCGSRGCSRRCSAGVSGRVAGNRKKISLLMYMLAALFVLKYFLI